MLPIFMEMETLGNGKWSSEVADERLIKAFLRHFRLPPLE